MKKIFYFSLVIVFTISCTNKKSGPSSCVKVLPESGQINIGEFKAGVAEGFLDFPVGVSMAGFGGRKGGDSPYNSALGASAGFYNRPKVKALALSNGAESIVIVKTPLIFPTLYLSERISEKLKSDYGLDLWNNIILTATHTHSGPARFWRLFEGFGLFGLDEVSGEVIHRLVNSIVTVIVEAVSSMEPARFGYGINWRFDPEDRINRDRRCEDDNVYTDLSNNDVYLKGDTYKTKDNSMAVFRVEKKNGEPIAALVNVGLHGTVFEDENFTEDAPGAVEMHVEDAFGKRGQRLIALFVQGAAGDVSPAGDYLGHSGTQQLEVLGKAISEKVLALWDSITTSDKIPMEIVSMRFNISREEIGYSDTEFINYQGLPYELGAFGCGGSEGMPGVDCGNPETKLVDGNLPCLFDIEKLIVDEISREGFQQFLQTRITAAKIGDLHIVTLPGEPLSMLANELEEKAQESYGIQDVVTFGYSQDHQLYLSKPEEWWQGGYESFMNIWGPEFGEYLIDRGLELLTQVVTPEKEDNSACEPERLYYSPLDESYHPSTSSNPEPSVYIDTGSKYKRFDTVIFEWNGGDPAVDFPVLTVEKKMSDGTFQPLTGDNLKNYDNTRYYMVTRYRAIPPFSTDRAATVRQHIWRVEWELPVDVRIGRYRLKAEGRYSKDTLITDYTVYSREFDIVPADTLFVSDLKAQWIGNDYLMISLIAKYPPNQVVYGQPDGYTTTDNQIAGFRVRDFLSSQVNPIMRTGIAIVTFYDTSGLECDRMIATYNPFTERFDGYYVPVLPGCPDSASPVVKIKPKDLIDEWGNSN